MSSLLSFISRPTLPQLPPLSPLDEEWRAHAACAGYPPSLFYPTSRWDITESYHNDYIEARKICTRCSVRDACLEEAMRTGDLEGMRGGLTPNQLRALAVRRRFRRVHPSFRYRLQVQE
jgi:WhiB family transcriptional regulator, redox-sensing transcriptional regulator